MRNIWMILLVLIYGSSYANHATTINVYIWGNEIPKKVIHDFEQATNIKVNLSTFDSNETMYTKLKTNRVSPYDVIMPSSYYVDRMIKQNLLAPLNHTLLPKLHELDSYFKNQTYDQHNKYSAPIMWGATGIFYNKHILAVSPTHWSMLWEPRWKNSLLLLDDSREIFSIALLRLGFNPNDTNPEHIRLAYEQLLKLVPNIKLFTSDAIQSTMIDEDALLGVAWNADVTKSRTENAAIHFIFPQEGFIVWIDCLAIPHNAQHPQAAHIFINFMLSAAAQHTIAIMEGHAITNRFAKQHLPIAIKNNHTIYPDAATMQRAYIQKDVGESILTLYNDYWQRLKLSF